MAASARKSLLRVGVGSGATPVRSALGPAPPGRPVSNIGKYLLKPTAESKTGWETLNNDPDVLKQVHQKYLKKGELPPGLAPTRLGIPQKPEVLEANRAKNISKGWRKPRSRQG